MSSVHSPPPAIPLTPDNVAAIWQQVLEKIGDMTADMAAKSNAVAISAPNRLVVTFPAKYTFCKTYCEQPDRLAKFEETSAGITGQPVRIGFQLSKDDPPEELGLQQKNGNDTVPEPALDHSQHPLVRRAAELFRARPVKFEAPAKSDSSKPPTAMKTAVSSP